MLLVVVDYPEIILFAHLLQIEIDKIKALQRLLQRGRDDVDLAPARALEQAESPCQRRREGRLDIFPGDENKRLVEPADLGALVKKSKQVIYLEFLERLQQEWFAPQRRAVQPFTLGVDEGFLDDPDHKFCVPGVEIVGRALQIPKEPVAGLLQLPAGDLLPGNDAVHVPHHDSLVRVFFSRHRTGPPRASTFSPASSRRRPNVLWG